MPAIITVGGSSSTGAGATFGDLIEKVYRRVMGGVRERTVSLATAISANDTSINLSGAQVGGIALLIAACSLLLREVFRFGSMTPINSNSN